MRLIDADELNEYIGRESLDTREKIFALVDRMPTLPNPCGKPCAFERPYGEWIFHKHDKNFECSNCHVRFDRTQIYTEKRFENALWAKMEMYKFCPNCGASMVANDKQVTGKLDENTQKHYGFRKKY